MKKIVSILAFVLAVSILPCTSQAAGTSSGPSLEVVFFDGLVGGGIGALAGTATLAFMDHPGDHLNRIVQGAAVGVLCGIAYGMYEVKPVIYSYTGPGGKEETAYGLNLTMPLK